ncbi:MAG: M60 family metallopeptidase [Phycisphaerales bacterium]
MLTTIASVVSTVWAACIAAAGATAVPTPIDALLHDVATLRSGGNPASLVAWGDAEALLVAPDGRVFAAASTLGRGRVVAIGHGGFVSTTEGDSEVFAANAVGWLAGREAHVGDGLSDAEPIRVAGLTNAIEGELDRRGVAFERVQAEPRDLDFDAVDVVVGSAQAFERGGRLADLRAWIDRGGGMLLTETAWGQLQLNPDLTVDTLAANRLLEAAGIRFTHLSQRPFGPDGDYPLDRSLLSGGNATHALRVLAGQEEGDGVLAARVAGDAFACVPLDSPLVLEARAIAMAERVRLDEAYANLRTARLTPERDALARALIDLDSRLAMELSARDVRAHASSAAFPGPLGPDRVRHAVIELDAGVPGWRSTGLYAPPGEVVTIRVADALVGAGVHVQIGAWRDPHDHPYRVRLRDAIRRFPVDTPEVEVASAIGGPIYIDVPVGLARTTRGSVWRVEIDGAAEMPRYVSGVTDIGQWRSRIRHLDAPWAEFESGELVLTVPSSAVRDVEHPDAVMAHWVRVHGAMQSLEPRTDNHWADRPYRYVADVSVSWGYMYCPADGPIVIPASAAAAMFQIENFDANGPNNLWGHYHEMGHAHQNPLWTDGATGEVTVNIFTVYALHTVNGYPLDADVTRSTPRTAWETFDRHRSTGSRFEDVGGPFPRLQFYALLWHSFGFEAFHAAFDAMRALPSEARPRTQDEERNAFLIAFSEAVGRDLSGYFDAWGIEVTDQSRERLAGFEQWMPEPPAAADAAATPPG